MPTSVTSASYNFSYFQVSLVGLAWRTILFSTLRNKLYIFSEKEVCAWKRELTKRELQQHKFCLGSLSLCQGIYKFIMGQFALYFCWVANCTRSKSSLWRGESVTALANGYLTLASEFWIFLIVIYLFIYRWETIKKTVSLLVYFW